MRRRKKNTLLASILTAIGIIFVVLSETGITYSSYTTSDELEIYYLDVGQADSILIRNNEKNVLIDAGNNEDGKKLVEYFQNLNITEFDYVIGTHAHEDHIGGMDDIIKNFDINHFYMPDALTTTKTFEEVLDALDENGVTFETPAIEDKFNVSDCYFEVLSIGNNEENLNSTSIVLMMNYGKKKFLFTGDIESETEQTLLNKNIKTDVLKVAHHGSGGSTTSKFLQKVNPEYAIISVGQNNSYNHPHNEALNRLNKNNVKIYRTDIDGTILLTSDGTNIEFESIVTDTNG